MAVIFMQFIIGGDPASRNYPLNSVSILNRVLFFYSFLLVAENKEQRQIPHRESRNKQSMEVYRKWNG